MDKNSKKARCSHQPSILYINDPNRNTKRVCIRFTQAIEVKPGKWRYAAMNCRSRHCPRCAPRLAAKRAYQIEAAARQHRLKYFATLTLTPIHELDPLVLLRRLRGSWSKLRVYFRRRFGEPIAFIAVLELSSTGVPHLHVLLDRRIGEEWLVQTWVALGGGPFVKIKPVRELRGLARYLVKQLAELPAPLFPARTKRVTTSRGIHLSDYRNPHPTRLIFRPVGELRAGAGEHLLEDRGDTFLADTGGLR